MTQDEFNSLDGDAILIWPQAMTTTTTIELLEQGIAHEGECNYRLYSIQRFLDASSHLFKRVCLFVHPSVCLLVHL